MTDKTKDTEIQFKIEQEVKDDFYKKCRDNSINPSAWLRKKIYEFLNKNIETS